MTYRHPCNSLKPVLSGPLYIKEYGVNNSDLFLNIPPTIRALAITANSVSTLLHTQPVPT